MSSFVYCKGEGKERWTLIPDTKEAIEEAVRRGARFTTVLSVDKDVDAARAEEEKISYRGPLYFDLDSTNEEESLEDLQRLLLSLYIDYGVSMQDVMVWATGSKGFHVIVPARVFSKGRASQHLPYTYGNIASRFDLVTLDYGIYSGGKGRMWRIPGQKRDNGRYKTPLTTTNAFSMELGEIQSLTTKPSTELVEPENPGFAPQLAALYNACLFKPKKIEAVTTDQFKEVPGHPPCIQHVLQVKDLDPERRFNQITMTLASYFVARGKSLEEFTTAATHFVEVHHSSVYKTQTEKWRHLRSIFNYVQSKPREYGFVCSYAKKVTKTAVCPECPIRSVGGSKTFGIEVQDNAYYKVNTDGSFSQFSTFVIEPQKTVVIVDGPQVEYLINATLKASEGDEAHVVFRQPDWATKQGLIKRLPSPVYAFWGGDAEVQKIFHLLTNLKVPEQKGVRVPGLHKHNNQWHFVTHEGSLAAGNVADELLLVDDSFYRTKLLTTKPADKEVLELAKHCLWSFNDFSVAIPVLGWHVLTLFKERIFASTKQFPLLFVFGEAGAGKTLTVLNIRRFWAMADDYSIKSIGDQTKFTLTKAAAGSKGPVLYLDEFKSSQFRDYQVKNIQALIRTSYNNESADRGTSDQGVNVYHLTAPLCLTGEQIIAEKAVRDRIIEVQMTKRLSEPHIGMWRQLNALPIERIGSTLIQLALNMPDGMIESMLAAQLKALDSTFEDRPRLNMAMLMVGLQLLQKVFDDAGVEHDLPVHVERYKRFAAARQHEERTERLLSDVDRIFEVLDMMTMTERLTLRHGDHFQLVDKLLYIDMKRTFAYFGRFVAEFQLKDVEAMSFHSFSKLVKTEPYFVDKDKEHYFETGAKSCYIFDIDKMAEKGLAVSRLTTASAAAPKVEVDLS